MYTVQYIVCFVTPVTQWQGLAARVLEVEGSEDPGAEGAERWEIGGGFPSQLIGGLDSGV